MSNGKIVAVVGCTGEGKTTFVKKFSGGTNKKVYCYLRIESDFIDSNTKVFTNFMDFLKEAHTKSNCVFIIDEAVTCLPKKLSVRMDKPNSPHNMLSDFLVNARKSNNFVFIIMHALAQVPTDWLIPYLDYFVRFNTNDMMQYQLQRFREFPEIVNNLITVPKVEK
ncbi:MAG: ATP-binding protein, partial [Bacteroidia bacterium]